MAQQTDEEPKLGISPAQVAGSALAAVSGAVLASFAGVTGTIIGAAVGSVVATVGAAIYTWSLRRTSAVVRRRAAQVRQTALLTGQLPRTVAQGPMRSRNRDAEQTPAEQAAAEAEDEDQESVRRALPWGKLAIASVGVTALALGGITTFEAVTGQPISSLVGGDDTKGTTVGNVVRKEPAAPEKQQPTEERNLPEDESSQAPEPEQDSEPSEGPEQPDTSTQPNPTTPGEPVPQQPEPSTGSEGAPAAEPSQAP